MSIRGAVDRLHEDGASGWIYYKGSKATSVVEAILLGRIIGEATANLERADLAAVGFGDGLCGFDINFYQRIEKNLLPFVSIRPQGGDVELPRTNLTGFVEFFSFVNSRYPRAGKFKSIFGGLWTDRNDAIQVLEGRVAVKGCKPESANVLQNLISQGYALLSPGGERDASFTSSGVRVKSFGGVVEPSANSDASTVLEEILDLFSEDAILNVLRAVFDDNPLICRTEFFTGNAAAFCQPSALESLPSPAECILMVTTAGDASCEVDIVVGSHEMPEFTLDGRSRWVSKDAVAAVDVALSNGASIKTLELKKSEIALLSPGTIYRLRSGADSRMISCLAIPMRQTPHYFLTRPGQQFRIAHSSGAALVA